MGISETRIENVHALAKRYVLVQVLSDTDLDVFVRERITEPLGMADSGFCVPPAALERFAAAYQYLEDGAFCQAGRFPSPTLPGSAKASFRRRRDGGHHR